MSGADVFINKLVELVDAATAEVQNSQWIPAPESRGLKEGMYVVFDLSVINAPIMQIVYKAKSDSDLVYIFGSWKEHSPGRGALFLPIQLPGGLKV